MLPEWFLDWKATDQCPGLALWAVNLEVAAPRPLSNEEDET